MNQTGDAKIDDLNKQFLHGFNFDADAQYFFKQGWGLGINANYSSSDASGSGLSVPGTSGIVNNYKETQGVLFIGPAFVARNESSRFLLVSSVALGPLFYADKITMDGSTIDGSKVSFGFNAGLAGEYKVSSKTGLGLKLSYTLGSIKSVNFEGLSYESDERISISNFMVTAFLSFRSW